MNSSRLKLLLLVTCMVTNAVASTDADTSDTSHIELVNAERQYKQLIADIEVQKGSYAVELVDPLIELAHIEAKTGRLDQAHENLRRAQHLTHRKDGVYALRQLEIIDLLFELHLIEGEFNEAESAQQFALFVSERNTGKDSPELLPALIKIARWQFETGQYQQSRRTLDRAQQIVITQFGESDPRMVELLRLEARTHQLEGSCCARDALEQAREIMTANPQQNDDYVALLLSLADDYIANRKPELAYPVYRQAADYQTSLPAGTTPNLPINPRPLPMYEDFAQHTPFKRTYVPRHDPFGYSPYPQTFLEKQHLEEEISSVFFVVPYEDHQYNIRVVQSRGNLRSEESLRQLIGEPLQFELDHLLEILPSSYKHAGKLDEIKMQLDFTVLADGSVRNMEITSGNAPNKLSRLVKQAMSVSKFRPRLENGTAVDTDHVEMEQTFSTDGDMISRSSQ